MPETVKQAVLYAVSNMYENRENFETKEVLETMTRLLFSYRRESW
ncbi:head-tail connector protein [Clostridium algidicarnis]